MSFQLPFGVRVLNPTPVDDKYLNAGTPYTDVTQANTLIAAGVRHIGLTVNIDNVEYWYETGTTNGSLVVKSPSVVSGGGITGATNGLTKTGANVKLGGTLTGNTEITAGGLYDLDLGTNASKLNSFGVYSDTDIDLITTGNFKVSGTTSEITFTSGLTYSDDYSANFTPRSLVDKAYVDEFSTLQGVLDNGGTGTTTNSVRIISHQVDSNPSFFARKNDSGSGYGGIVAFDNGTSDVSVGIFTNGLTGDSSSVLNSLEKGLYVSGVNTEEVILKYVSTVLTLKSGLFRFDDGYAFYLNDESANFNNPRAIPDVAFITGLTTTSGIQTANNGLTKNGTNVRLGGALTGSTTISGGDLTLSNGNFGYYHTNERAFIGDINDTGEGFVKVNDGNFIEINSGAGANIQMLSGDTTLTLGFGGTFKYNADYSANFTDRSLVDKQYVDNLAAGLDPKAAAKVATTAAITGTYVATGGTSETGSFTGVSTTVVDGYTIVNGDRILVKNQADLKQNGVYVRTSSTVWTRSTDMDGTPAAEVSTGNYVFVTTGDTQAASGWVVIGSGDTLTLNTNNIEWAQFSAAISAYIGGDGIDITGASIDVDLATDSGLDFTGNQLRVAPTIAGDGLTLTAGVLDVGAANGLTASGNNVVLGGTLTGATTINALDTSNRLSFGTFPVEYVADYSANFTPRSLVDKAYVTGLTSSSGVQTANNGLTKSGSNVRFGGTLTGSTILELDTFGLYQVRSGQAGRYARISMDNDGTRFENGPTSSSNSTILDLDRFGGATISSNVSGFQALKYAANYAANYTNRSLVDKQYVDNKVSTGFTVNNGLTKSGTNVRLGGTLTGDTTIDGNAGLYDINFTNIADFNVSSNNFDISNNAATIDVGGAGTIALNSDNLVANATNFNVDISGTGSIVSLDDFGIYTYAGELTLSGDTVIIGSNSGSFAGAQYDTNNSANFTARSLVDAGYVTGLTSNITIPVTGASNGLSLQSGNVRLGGVLTGNTVVDGGDYSLTLGSISSKLSGLTSYVDGDLDLNVDSGDITLNVTNGDVRLGNTVQRFFIDESAERIYIQAEDTSTASQIVINKTGATGIQISTQESNTNITIEASNGDIIIGGGADSNLTVKDVGDDIVVTLASGSQFNYAADYSANFTERSLVDAAFVTGLTSNITVNKLIVNVVNSSTTLTSANHVVLVNTSGATTITLPSSPNDGQVYHIKDKSGNAFTNTITIDGDGKTIDGSGTASINTDYGSLYIVYSSTEDAWFSLAFVN